MRGSLRPDARESSCVCLRALAVPSHALSGTAREAGLIDGDDSNIQTFGEFAESPFDNLLRDPPPFKLGMRPFPTRIGNSQYFCGAATALPVSLGHGRRS